MKAIYTVLLVICMSNALAGTITVGTLSTNPPFQMEATDENGNQIFTGFDISIMREICQRMHDTCQFQSIDFHKIEQAINEGTIDLAIAAIIITPERRKEYGFSLPYLPSYLQFVTLKNNPINTIDDLKNKNVGIYLDSPAEQWVRLKFGGQIKITTYKHSEPLFDALVNQDIDALVTSSESAKYWISEISHDFQYLGKQFAIGQGYGIMTKKNNEFLINKMNKALENIEQNGVYLKIYKDSLIH